MNTACQMLTPFTSPKSVSVPLCRVDSRTMLQELPVAICINGISQAVMMASPDNLEMFGLGFALSEGWISSVTSVLDITVEHFEQGASVNLDVLAGEAHRLKVRRRSMAGPTGCGLCGVESIKAALAMPTSLSAEAPHWLPTADAIIAAGQQLHDARGRSDDFGRHAAALFDADATLLIRQTDVGRHCALDKLIGTAHRQGLDQEQHRFVMLTSRCSHDLVAKLVRALPYPLVTLAQPTSLAVASAQAAGLPLFCYQQRTLRRFA